jgi:hypothetical protein
MWVFCFGGQGVGRPKGQNAVERKMMNATLNAPAGRSDWTDRFAWHPDPPAPFRGTDETELERLKHRLLKAALEYAASPGLIPLLRRAANEAAALAWLEPHPLLVFPTLFEEKTATARKRHHKQDLVRSRSLTWMEVTA